MSHHAMQRRTARQTQEGHLGGEVETEEAHVAAEHDGLLDREHHDRQCLQIS